MTTLVPRLPTFPMTELERALSEQSFGILGYQITEGTDLEAVARVLLLEGNNVLISLTSRGYAVQSASPDSTRGNVFEAIEDLLQSTSAMYGAAKQQVLIDKLFALQ